MALIGVLWVGTMVMAALVVRTFEQDQGTGIGLGPSIRTRRD